MDREGKSLELAQPNQPAWSVELLKGWKREIEFLTQFLQLINGGELPEIRLANTIQAIDSLSQSSCLTEQERSILVTAYNRFSQTIISIQLQDPIATKTHMQREAAESNDQLDAELADSWSKVKQIRNHLRGEVFADENQVTNNRQTRSFKGKIAFCRTRRRRGAA